MFFFLMADGAKVHMLRHTKSSSTLKNGGSYE